MQDEKIIEVLLDRFPGKRITCAEAREFAAELQIELSRMGALCDQAGIKISACQLGCF
ncbi:MAG: hypothetical protein GXZ09_09525 [Syntrophomonadaceae bacterium]|jgi:hypothetical protein|nr:hypothetical protein [Syntrophomonadaceae bacterium]